MPNLSKSKLLSFRQCAKRLWLELKRPDLLEESSATQARFAIGHKVGDIARKIYDPTGVGQLIDPQAEGIERALARTKELLQSRRPIFEGGFSADGALAFADIMLPIPRSGKPAWRMVEVKSATSVKDYHRDDAAIQARVALKAGVRLAAIALARIDSTWTYAGDGNYEGLLVEEDLTDEAFNRGAEVDQWISEAQAFVQMRAEPDIRTGSHCTQPFECPFISYCQGQEPQPIHPIAWLPGQRKKALQQAIEEHAWTEMREVPDDHLSESQRLVKNATITGKAYFDAEGARADLTPHKLPAYFMDFETVSFAVPIWKGTRPYQQILFQFSVHRLSKKEVLDQREFIDLSGQNPSKALAEALIEACGEMGPVFVYNASFEKTRIRELAVRFPRLKSPLLAINDRIVDLHPVAKKRFYHPSQQGSWSIKYVLPAIASDLGYDTLDGVQDGGMAMEAFFEAISPDTTDERKSQIESQLRVYCGLDTFAMIRLWQYFTGRAPSPKPKEK